MDVAGDKVLVEVVGIGADKPIQIMEVEVGGQVI
jgi:hypothetical protein